MREMKDSGVAWIGEIPVSWTTETIKHLTCERNEKNKQLEVNTILSLSAKDGVTLYNSENHSGNKPREDLSGYKIVRENDIVINSMNILSGSVGLSRYTGVVSPVYYIYYPRSNDNLEFLYYIFQCKEFQRSLWGLGNGILIKETESGSLNTIRIRIPSKKLGYQLFPYCSRKEQDKIVTALDNSVKRVDSLIANQEQQIEKLKAYKQSLITEVVTKGLNPDAPMKPSCVEWIGEIPESWEVYPLKLSFAFGKGLPITKADLTPTGIKVISYGQIHAKYNSTVNVDDRLYRYVSDSYLESNASSLVSKNDMIFADTSEDVEGAGNFVFIDRDDTIFAGYHTLILKSLRDADNRYLAFLFMSNLWKNQVQSLVKGIKVYSVTRSILSNTTYILPTEQEQQQIVEYLDEKCSKIDRLVEIKQQKIDKLNDYKKSLIYEYVTGKKEA